MKVLAIVPARGGSKGIPGKNLKLLGSKPLIAYPIQEVQNSNLDIELVVSTDDTAIADLASRYNARVIMRPLELGSDSSPVIDSVIHVLNQFKEEGIFFRCGGPVATYFTILEIKRFGECNRLIG